MFHNITFYGEELLAPRPTPKLEDHPLSAVRDCLFNTFAATLHIWRPFLHPQPEDAPCRGDRDRLIRDEMYRRRTFHLFWKRKFWTSKVSVKKRTRQEKRRRFVSHILVLKPTWHQTPNTFTVVGLKDTLTSLRRTVHRYDCKLRFTNRHSFYLKTYILSQSQTVLILAPLPNPV
jgi:hypothetical protein